VSATFLTSIPALAQKFTSVPWNYGTRNRVVGHKTPSSKKDIDMVENLLGPSIISAEPHAVSVSHGYLTDPTCTHIPYEDFRGLSTLRVARSRSRHAVVLGERIYAGRQ
jgi:hypothetical protein